MNNSKILNLTKITCTIPVFFDDPLIIEPHTEEILKIKKNHHFIDSEIEGLEKLFDFQKSDIDEIIIDLDVFIWLEAKGFNLHKLRCISHIIKNDNGETISGFGIKDLTLKKSDNIYNFFNL